MIRIVLPHHLRTLARVDGDVELDVAAPVSIRAILDVLESRFPMLRGTIREHETGKRRPLLRFYVCEEDWSYEPHDKVLPTVIAEGKEPFFIIGSIAGG
jgi:sulfur-carrier protein